MYKKYKTIGIDLDNTVWNLGETVVNQINKSIILILIIMIVHIILMKHSINIRKLLMILMICIMMQLLMYKFINMH